MSNELKVTGGEWRTESFLGDWVIYNDADELVETVYSGEANAHLLAASKKLYEALDACASYMEQLRASGDVGFWDWKAGDEYSNAIAALAAARGEAQ